MGTASIDRPRTSQDGKVDDNGGVVRDQDAPNAYKHFLLAQLASLATQDRSVTRAVECSAVRGRAPETMVR